MSEEKRGHEDIEKGVGTQRTLTTVTLTPEQFEALYLQPQGRLTQGGHNDIVRRVGNAAPLAVTCFLLTLTPLSMDLLGFQAATAASGLAILGAFYGCTGIGLWVAAIMEWAAGNTFPMVVFGSFGGFWISFAILNQPSFRVAAGFSPANITDNTFAGVTATAAGAATREYNSGVGLYFVIWAVVCFIYMIASTRTNVAFFILFLSLTIAFSFLASAYFHTGLGEMTKAAKEFKVAGAFAFVTSLAGFWIDISLILKAVDFPIEVPIFDLSGVRFMQPRRGIAANGISKHRTD